VVLGLTIASMMSIIGRRGSFREHLKRRGLGDHNGGAEFLVRLAPASALSWRLGGRASAAARAALRVSHRPRGISTRPKPSSRAPVIRAKALDALMASFTMVPLHPKKRKKKLVLPQASGDLHEAKAQ